ncbi:MAG: hypothetical protein ACYDGM_10200 [Vulcanimicrobiaceae bacterium]
MNRTLGGRFPGFARRLGNLISYGKADPQGSARTSRSLVFIAVIVMTAIGFAVSREKRYTALATRAAST